ncbi:MAG: glyoxalase superfamily protein [Alphaproteobacteria bacterium]
MTISKHQLPSLKIVKELAKRLRSDLADDDTSISHSKSLELISHQLGFKDWNTLHFAIGNRPTSRPINVGDILNGRYLGQSFEAEVLGVKSMAGASRFRLTLDLLDPIDVVKFDSFSSMRKRISCTVNRDGISAEKTSNGKPQIKLELSQ